MLFSPKTPMREPAPRAACTSEGPEETAAAATVKSAASPPTRTALGSTPGQSLAQMAMLLAVLLQ
jgi:hypothetical protein